MRSFFEERLIVKQYAQYLCDLNHVHTTLEKLITAHSRLDLLYLKGHRIFRRALLIQKDLAETQIKDLKPSKAAKAYALHLKETSSISLLAHIYVLYYGDLNAGKIICDRGLKYPMEHYQFSNELKLNLKTNLTDNTIGSLAKQPHLILKTINEARTAFGFSIAMLNEACSEQPTHKSQNQ